MLSRHGMHRTPEYDAWRGMRSRCYRESHREFKNYGARGISVCAQWRDSFQEFYNYIGPRPGIAYSLDRINADGNYEPGNVRWATRTDQNRNFSDRNSPLGIRGVRWFQGRFYVQLHVNHKAISLGGHDSFFDACCARKSAENRYWREK